MSIKRGRKKIIFQTGKGSSNQLRNRTLVDEFFPLGTINKMDVIGLKLKIERKPITVEISSSAAN